MIPEWKVIEDLAKEFFAAEIPNAKWETASEQTQNIYIKLATIATNFLRKAYDG